VTGSVALRAERSLSPAGVSTMLVAGLTLVGLVLRAAGLDESLYGDELYTYELSERPGVDDVVSGVAGDLEISPPLYFVFAWAATKLGEPHVWLRVPSFVTGVAAIPALYLLGLRTVGRAAALAGAALLALSPFAILYAAEARSYALTMLFVLLSTLALLAALESRRARDWGLFALAAWAALLSHYTAVFPLVAQAGWVVFAHRERLRELAFAGGATAVGLLPWLPAFLDDRSADFQTAIETYWPLTLSFFFRSLGGWLAGNPYVGLRGIPGDAALVLIGAGLLLGLAGAPRALAALRRRETLLIVLIAFAAPVGAVLYSLVFPSVFVPRTLLPCLPALCLALGLLLTSGPRLLSAVALILVLAGLALGAVRVVVWSPKPPIREAARHIDARAAPRDPVLVYIFDFGSIDAALTPPFLLYRDGCPEPATGPGQLLTAEVRCEGAATGFDSAARRPSRRLFVLAPAGPRPAIPELRGRWRLQGSRAFENHFYPLQVLEYARR
jgi:Dolichyl-phosphate-mannose-protein mannosyltransferase